MWPRPVHCPCYLQSCSACDVNLLSVKGACIPGRYTFQYSVLSSDGSRTAVVNRTVVVFQSATLNATFEIFKGLPNAASADIRALALNQNSSTDVAEAVAGVREALGDAGNGVADGDIVIRTAASKQQDSTNYSVTVDATIFLYIPKGVHLSDVDPANAAVQGGGGRRLLQYRFEGPLVASWSSNMLNDSNASRQAEQLLQQLSRPLGPNQSRCLSAASKKETLAASRATPLGEVCAAAPARSNVGGTDGPVWETAAVSPRRSLLATSLAHSLAAAAAAASSSGASGVVMAAEGTADVDQVAVRDLTVHLASVVHVSLASWFRFHGSDLEGAGVVCKIRRFVLMPCDEVTRNIRHGLPELHCPMSCNV